MQVLGRTGANSMRPLLHFGGQAGKQPRAKASRTAGEDDRQPEPPVEGVQENEEAQLVDLNTHKDPEAGPAKQ
jgi:hypothetical protein